MLSGGRGEPFSVALCMKVISLFLSQTRCFLVLEVTCCAPHVHAASGCGIAVLHSLSDPVKRSAPQQRLFDRDFGWFVFVVKRVGKFVNTYRLSVTRSPLHTNPLPHLAWNTPRVKLQKKTPLSAMAYAPDNSVFLMLSSPPPRARLRVSSTKNSGEDYVGELLVNLRHNVEVNRTPRVVSTVAPRKPIEHRRSRSGLKEDADHAPATGPHRGRPELQRCGRQRDGQRQQQQQQQQQQTSEPEHQQHLQIDDLREKTMAEITSRQRHHRVPDGDAPSDTVGRVGSPGRRDLERRGHKENSPVRISAAATANDAVVVSDGRDFLPPPPQATPLLPLSRADVRKLDWTTYAGDGEAGRASGGKEGGGGWWWDDRGPDTSQSGWLKRTMGIQTVILVVAAAPC